MTRAASASAAPLLDLAPAYWRILVERVPRTAADRLARDIRSGQFGGDGLRQRARDLRAHVRPDIRERARTELFPALSIGHDGIEPTAHFD
jgi:hypothetical protein